MFKRHFDPSVGELRNRGDGFDCAVAIHESTVVAFWVTNET